MSYFCQVINKINIALVKYAEDIPGLTIKCGYTVVSNIHKH